MIMVSLLLILSLAVRLGIDLMPETRIRDLEEFERQARLIMDEIDRLDSLEATEDSHAALQRPDRINRRRQDPAFFPLELNSADSAALLPLPGIGPVYAGRIIKYRELLGGYVGSGQLMEVYGMDSARFLPLLPLVKADVSRISKLDLNKASFRDLLRHPYLEFNHVKALVNYRDRVGHIGSTAELRQNAILPDTVLNRVFPYLVISP